MLNALQPWHIIVLVIVLIALFGAKRLPDAARGVGKSMRIFKAEAKHLRDEHEAGKNEDDDTDTDTADSEPRQVEHAQPVQATAGAEQRNHVDSAH